MKVEEIPDSVRAYHQRTKSRWMLGLVALITVILAAGCSALSTDRLAQRAMQNRQENAAEVAAELQRTDAITAVLCGTGSPLGLDRAQACTAIFVNGQFLLFDSGDRAVASMQNLTLPMAEIDALFYTHFHADHYADMGEIMDQSWLNGRRHILPIHGPTGITQIVDGFRAAYELEYSYRTAHHGEAVMPAEWSVSEAVEFDAPENGDAVVVYQEDGVTVEAFRVSHEPIRPAVGYRISYAGKRIVISGDTVLTTPLTQHSQDADLLIAEVMNMAQVAQLEQINRANGNDFLATLLFDIRDYHMDASDVGALARDAGVKHLALTHLAPQPQGRQIATWFVDPISVLYEGEISAGEDGLQIVIPLNEANTIPAVTPSQSMPIPDDLRNFRYCEVIPIFRERGTLFVEVYNTLGSNDCPADLWEQLDAEAFKEEWGAVEVILNGPRYWVINGLIGSGESVGGKVIDTGGIEQTLRARLEQKLWGTRLGEDLYAPNEVQRSTTYTYLAGNRVYELTSPQGDIYIMQSYAQFVDETLTIDDLEFLGDRLALPEGWVYESRVLEEDLRLTADGLAFVINDDLGNSYQRR